MLSISITHPKLTNKLRKLSRSIPTDKDNKSTKGTNKVKAIETMFYMGLIAIPIRLNST